MKKKHIADIFLIIGLFVLTIILSIFIYKKQLTDNLYVEVSIDGKIDSRFVIDKDVEIMLSTGNKLIIKDGLVSIHEANCPDKLCIKQGSISKMNESIICLPNKLIVRIVQDKKSSAEDDTGMDIIQWVERKLGK